VTKTSIYYNQIATKFIILKTKILTRQPLELPIFLKGQKSQENNRSPLEG